MSNEQAVRTALESRALLVPSDPMSGPALRTRAVRARRVRRRLGGLAVAVAVGIVAVLVAVPAVVDHGSLPPASSQVDGWPVRGDLAGDTALLAAARVAWEAAPVYRAELPHHDVHVLLAARTEFGRYVVLTGLNARGHRRLAVFSDDPRDHAPYRHRLRLRWDNAFPSGKLVTYFSTRQVDHKDRTLMLVAAPTDVTSMRWRAASDGTWADLPSADGVAATMLDSGALDFKIRAYRPHGNRITYTARPSLGQIYQPDETVLLPGDDGSRTTCHGGTCTSSMSGTMTVAPLRSGDLTAAQAQPADPWEDMSDQADQLWLDYGAQRRSVTSWGGGTSASGLLPDGTGVYFAMQQVNGGGAHAVLYVDRPEWPIGRLYLAAPVPDGQPLRAVSAIVPAAHGRQLVVVAAEGVSIRYRIGDGGWTRLDIAGRVGAGHLPDGVDVSDVRVEVTYGDSSTVTNVDSAAALPLP